MGGKNTNNGKMRIRMLTPASGTGWNAAALEEVDRPKDEALRFIAGGLAEDIGAPENFAAGLGQQRVQRGHVALVQIAVRISRCIGVTVEVQHQDRAVLGGAGDRLDLLQLVRVAKWRASRHGGPMAGPGN